MICQYGCNQEAEYEQKNGKWCCTLHPTNCPAVKEKIVSKLKLAHENGKYENRNWVSWNKGKTKETDERVKRNGENVSKSYKNGNFINWQTGKTKENNESILEQSKKISKTVNEKIKSGTWHLSFSKRRIHEYKGIKFNGTWELKYAKYLDENSINWRRPTESFLYIFEGKSRRYTPDFYLIDDDLYIEIKGYETPKDRAKWEQFPLKLEVLKGNELKKMGLIDSYKDVSK